MGRDPNGAGPWAPTLGTTSAPFPHWFVHPSFPSSSCARPTGPLPERFLCSRPRTLCCTSRSRCEHASHHDPVWTKKSLRFIPGITGLPSLIVSHPLTSVLPHSPGLQLACPFLLRSDIDTSYAPFSAGIYVWGDLSSQVRMVVWRRGCVDERECGG